MARGHKRHFGIGAVRQQHAWSHESRLQTQTSAVAVKRKEADGAWWPDRVLLSHLNVQRDGLKRQRNPTVTGFQRAMSLGPT
jgi:hypothetical protein